MNYIYQLTYDFVNSYRGELIDIFPREAFGFQIDQQDQ